ncbi:hypothetical protein [Spiroplasma turonicum]|uniref:Uncharacterized protein n=1 Tax=Spiroplasma turonicum TaxID=216946 RepID=A0A0K1P788_9MOLU|nr:hypothetical protein [Spiroplasma turonicum]AKU79757.1 hypothetical protein STURON_00511 [Spiroplasma turonicum]ALX70775.1 hypothetical protein STURO_v1c05090 [Spiroplasma turonicum]
MLEYFLNKEEQKAFSKANLNKLKKEDFFSYLQMEERVLESLINYFDTTDKKNLILEMKINKQKDYVDKLNKYYYDVILLKPTEEMDIKRIAKEFKKTIKPYKKILKY